MYRFSSASRRSRRSRPVRSSGPVDDLHLTARPKGDEAHRIAGELREWVGKEIGSIAKPKDIRFGDNLPKTRSGKILRGTMRKIADGEKYAMPSTIDDPTTLGEIETALKEVGYGTKQGE